MSTSYGFSNGPIGIQTLAAQYMPRAYTVDVGTLAEVAADTSAEQTVTVTGLTTDDAVMVSKPTAQAGIGIVGARVSAANTLAITFMNATASGVTPTADEVYKVVAFKAA